MFGPNELGWLEAGLAALAGTGLTGTERIDTIVLLSGHVRSLVQQTTASGTASDTTKQDLAVVLRKILTSTTTAIPRRARPSQPAPRPHRTTRWTSAWTASWTAWPSSSPSKDTTTSSSRLPSTSIQHRGVPGRVEK